MSRSTQSTTFSFKNEDGSVKTFSEAEVIEFLSTKRLCGNLIAKRDGYGLFHNDESDFTGNWSIESLTPEPSDGWATVGVSGSVNLLRVDREGVITLHTGGSDLLLDEATDFLAVYARGLALARFFQAIIDEHQHTED